MTDAQPERDDSSPVSCLLDEYHDWRKQAGDAYELSHDRSGDCMCDTCLQINGLAQLVAALDDHLQPAADELAALKLDPQLIMRNEMHGTIGKLTAKCERLGALLDKWKKEVREIHNKHTIALGDRERALDNVDNWIAMYEQEKAQLDKAVAALNTDLLSIGDSERFAAEVHAAWRDGMITQGRTVADNRMVWEGMDKRERQLDYYIAARLVRSVLVMLREIREEGQDDE